MCNIANCDIIAQVTQHFAATSAIIHACYEVVFADLSATTAAVARLTKKRLMGTIVLMILGSNLHRKYFKYPAGHCSARRWARVYVKCCRVRCAKTQNRRAVPTYVFDYTGFEPS